MVGGGHPARLLAPLEKRELGDPDELEGALVDEAQRPGRQLPDGPKRRRRDLRAIGHRDHHLAGLGLSHLLQGGELPLVEEFRDR